MATQVGKAKVEREEDAVFASRRRRNDRVGLRKQTLIDDMMKVMPHRAQRLGQVAGQVLVQLDRHAYADTFQTFSRANSAPYAAAA